MTTDVETLVEVDLLPDGIRDDLSEIASSVRVHKSATVEAVLEIGRLLGAARIRLSKHRRGVFCRWVESECGISWQTATNCIRSFEVWGESNFKTVLKLETTALYLLSAPSCPAQARDEAENIAESGSPVTAKLARELVAKHKEAEPEEDMNAIEVAAAIRSAIWKVYQSCPEQLRGMVAPKFKEFADELAKTGDLSW